MKTSDDVTTYWKYLLFLSEHNPHVKQVLLNSIAVNEEEFYKVVDAGILPSEAGHRTILSALAPQLTDIQLSLLKSLYIQELNEARQNGKFDLGIAYLRQSEIAIESQLSQIEEKVGWIIGRLEQVESPNESQVLDVLITEIRGEIYRLRERNSELTARVVPPPSEQLEVRLVTTTSLGRLEEYQNDQGVWLSLVGLFLGAVLGLLINWVSGGVLTREGWILIVGFSLIAGVFGCLFIQGRRRIADIKAQALGVERTNAQKK